MMLNSINLNDYVKVRLTDYGKDIFYHQYDDLIVKGVKIKRYMPNEDENGLTEIQLWHFIELYGKYLGMAKPNVIEPLNIYFEGDE